MKLTNLQNQLMQRVLRTKAPKVNLHKFNSGSRLPRGPGRRGIESGSLIRELTRATGFID